MTLAEAQQPEDTEECGPLGPLPHEIVEGENLPEALEYVNEMFCTVLVGSRHLIGFTPMSPETGHREIRFMGEEAFKSYLRTYKVTRKGKTPLPLASVWLDWARHRDYDNTTVESDASKVHPRVWNLWDGFSLAPVKGDWSLMRDHMRDVFCKGNDIYFQYLLKWSAWCVQNPTSVPEVAVVLKGGEGAGKGFFARAMLKLFGSHGLAMQSPKMLVGAFNSHRALTCFAFADEAFFAGDPSADGILKATITEDMFMCEAKGVPAFPMKNRLKVLMSTNQDWAVRASKDARRYFVLQVGEQKVGNFDYFGELKKQMDNGGLAAMLYDLLTIDLKGFQVLARPSTAALQQEKVNSFGPAQRWAHTVLTSGQIGDIPIPRTKDKPADPGREGAFFSTRVLCDSLTLFLRGQPGRIPPPNVFGRFLRQLAGKRQLPGTSWGYYMSLERCQKAFEAMEAVPGLFDEEAEEASS